MNQANDALVDALLARLVGEWLAERTARPLSDISEDESATWRARLGPDKIVLTVAPVASGEAPAEWHRHCAALTERLGAEGGALVWVPGGASLPDREPALTALVDAIADALRSLGPGESGEAALPIEIRISKRDESGAYVSAFGGLAQHWARFTDRVQGYYQIDGTELHRLPDGEQYRDDLVDRLVEASRSLSLGGTIAVDAFDHWRVQRLRGGTGVGVVALPPQDESEAGTPLRRRLRVVLHDAGSRLAAIAADARVLVLYGHYPSIDDEPVGAALRGQDPSQFRGLDLVVLAADGRVRPLIDITRNVTLQRA